MSIRVASGSARGRLLAVPEGPSTRPTPNKVRQAVFNSLYSLGAVEDAQFLDLFAGTGALGIEALSRGAAHAVFVEHDPAVANLLRSNLALTGFSEAATVIAKDAQAALDELNELNELTEQRMTEHQMTEHQITEYKMTEHHIDRRFDVALIDPPYSFDAWPELLPRVPARLVVVESDRPVETAPSFIVHHHRRHGGTVVTFAAAAEYLEIKNIQ